ncbi:hypothetical protein [Stutzerimonas kunmingensis]|uniref:hypothetical protein n=1 Tax=Stutzerimonas kunmingensis TaxID=1211807 RepID=UPI0028B1D2D8|nr:hypothetical protein [Stutzerimonas kunmingensis]
MSGHTKGTWRKGERVSYGGDTHGFPIYFNDDGEQVVDYVYTEADADLICAAPDLLAVAECEEALDMPHNQAIEILERYGWSHADRLELPATEFVVRLRRAAIAKAKGQ